MLKRDPVLHPKKNSRETTGEKIFNVVNVLFMLALCVVVLLPMLNVISVSISADRYVAAAQVSFWPKGLNFKAYETVFESQKLLRSFLNTVLVTVCSALCSLTMTSLAAYPLAFGKFYGKRIYSLMILLTMWFSGGMIPKAACCQHAIQNGVASAHIINGQMQHSLLLELFTDDGVGTMVVGGKQDEQ